MELNLFPERTMGKIMGTAAISFGIAHGLNWLNRSVTLFNPVYAAIFTTSYLVALKISMIVANKLTKIIHDESEYKESIFGRLIQKSISVGLPVALLTSPYIGVTIPFAAANFAIYFLTVNVYKILRKGPFTIGDWSE